MSIDGISLWEGSERKVDVAHIRAIFKLSLNKLRNLSIVCSPPPTWEIRILCMIAYLDSL